MSKLAVRLLAVWCFCMASFSAAPSNAFSSFDQSFSGFVTSAIETAPSGPPKTDALMIAEPFTASRLTSWFGSPGHLGVILIYQPFREPL